MKIIQKGKWGNSDVYLHDYKDKLFVVKTFAHHPVLIRTTIGRFLISREYKALKKLASCQGTCNAIIRVGKCSLSYQYIKGQDLSSYSRQNNKTNKQDFFPDLERTVKEMHSLGIVHLDLRTGSNVIISEQGKPYIIDFQSYINLNFIPGSFFKKFLKSIDFSGVYKYWVKMSPETLGRLRKDKLKTLNKNRKIWFLKGYMVHNFIKNKNKKQVGRSIKP